MSRGKIVLGGHLSGGTLVWGDSCPGGTVVLGGHLSGGTVVQGDNCPGGQMSGGQMSGGHLSGGQMSQHLFFYVRPKGSSFILTFLNYI